MSSNCTGFASTCEFPFRLENSTNGCTSAADLLGHAFTGYNVAYIWAVALLLFGFLRSWLFHLRETSWHFVGRPSMLIPLLGTVAQFLAIIEATNLHLLRWPTRVWASLGCDLFVPCAFSALLVYFDQTYPRPQAPVSASPLHAPKNRASHGNARRLCSVMGHAIPWSLGLALSVMTLTTPATVVEGVSYIYIVPFVLILTAAMARGAWTMRTVLDHRSMQRRLIGLCALLALVAVYLAVRGISTLLGDGRRSPRPTPVTFPFESMPVPVAKIVGSTLAWFQYGRPRTDTPACKQSRILDPLTLFAAHITVLAGLMSTGFVAPTAEALNGLFLTAAILVPALFLAGLCAQLLRAGPLFERSEDDTAALTAQCKAQLSRAWTIPIVVKQVFTGSFLVSLSLNMGPARPDANGSSAAFHSLTVLVELETLREWSQGHRFGLSIGLLATYFILFGSFILLRLAAMPHWFLAATFASWALFYDLLLISATRFIMKGLQCDGGKLVVNDVPCDLGYAYREALWAGFMA